jgi:hypothetical protein
METLSSDPVNIADVDKRGELSLAATQKLARRPDTAYSTKVRVRRLAACAQESQPPVCRRFYGREIRQKLSRPVLHGYQKYRSSSQRREERSPLFKKTAATYYSSQNSAPAEISLHRPQDSISIKLLFRFSLATQNCATEPDFGFTQCEDRGHERVASPMPRIQEKLRA